MSFIKLRPYIAEIGEKNAPIYLTMWSASRCDFDLRPFWAQNQNLTSSSLCSTVPRK